MTTIKRKNEETMEGDEKKAKKENCPHAEKCYRRNPHHFKEYEHPHLMKHLDKSDDDEFPASFTQDKSVYVDQMKILKEVKKIKTTKEEPPKREVKKTNVAKLEPEKPSLASVLKRLKESPAKPKSPAASPSNKKSKTESSNSKDLPLASPFIRSKARERPSASTSKPSSASSSKDAATGSPVRKKMVKTTSFVPNQEGGNKMKNDLKKSCSTMMEKLECAKPYNIFFTKVPKAIQTLEPNNCISFPDLLCPSLGNLTNSLQINFMIDVMWLNEQYQVHGLGKVPMTILYGYEFPQMKEYMELKLKNVTHNLVKMKDPFGTHHSKVGIYTYEDGSLRIVVSTANLYYEDWNHYNQGLWVSPACPRMDASKQDYECAGPTGFKRVLIDYLNSYNLPMLKDWIQMVKRADFSEIKVFLITSIPGKHYPKDSGCHLQMVGDLLSKHCSLPQKTTPQSEGPLSWGVIAQSSSIGSLGKTAGDWLRTYLLRSLASHKLGPLPSNSPATLSMVYPCGANVMYSHFGAEGGGCLPYSKVINDKQKWFRDYLHQWKADTLGRSRAMPHIKSYCRVSPCLTKLAYFLLTSANLSKSAWGSNIQRDTGCYIRSYEMGVLFMPSLFDEEYFNIRESEDCDKVFPFMYDLPLTAYKADDEPWCN